MNLGGIGEKFKGLSQAFSGLLSKFSKKDKKESGGGEEKDITIKNSKKPPKKPRDSAAPQNVAAEKPGEDNVIRLDDEFNLQDIIDQSPKNKANAETEGQSFIKERPGLAILAALLVVALAVGVFMAIMSLFGGYVDKTPLHLEEEQPPMTLESTPPVIAQSDLEEMIRKANLLYASGNKIEALDIFGRISNYSEGLSSYNLGVAQMKEKDYNSAIESFQRAIDSGEDRVVSALNAAASALNLKQNALASYYIDLAQAYLPYAGNLPLYSYFYGLVAYYEGNYLGAISPLLHPTSQYYQEENARLLSTIFAYYNDDERAIEFLSKAPTKQDYFPLGLLYARVGDYKKSIEYIQSAIEENGKSYQYDSALQLIALKVHDYAKSSKLLEDHMEQNLRGENPYPIRTRLKESLFDIQEAQRRFWDSFTGQKLNAYKTLFYFAPYQVFNAREAIAIIKEGGLSINLNELQEAKDVLLRGATISRVNREIAQSILASLNGNIREANKILTQAVSEYANHSTLHYNLGLTLAQLGDFDGAYKHFLRAYHLNPKEPLFGLFAMIGAQLTYRNYERLGSQVGESIANISDEIEQQFYYTLLSFINGGMLNGAWMEIDKGNRSLYWALDFVLSVANDNKGTMVRAAYALKQIDPKDIMTNLLTLLAENYRANPHSLSLKMQTFYRDNTLNKNPLYYGPSVVREMYIDTSYIVGTLHYVMDDLENKLLGENNEVRGIVQAIALGDIYLREFEKSFALYNSLIDDLKEADTQTLFMAAVAAVGSNNPSNAAALLQLSKLEAPTNYETRAALGYLYQENKNYRAASTQFSSLANSRVNTSYFDFEIDSSKIIEDSLAVENNTNATANTVSLAPNP